MIKTSCLGLAFFLFVFNPQGVIVFKCFRDLAPCYLFRLVQPHHYKASLSHPTSSSWQNYGPGCPPVETEPSWWLPPNWTWIDNTKQTEKDQSRWAENCSVLLSLEQPTTQRTKKSNARGNWCFSFLITVAIEALHPAATGTRGRHNPTYARGFCNFSPTNVHSTCCSLNCWLMRTSIMASQQGKWQNVTSVKSIYQQQWAASVRLVFTGAMEVGCCQMRLPVSSPVTLENLPHPIIIMKNVNLSGAMETLEIITHLLKTLFRALYLLEITKKSTR